MKVEKIGDNKAQTVNNYYIDNRTQVVVNQPTRAVMVTDKEYDALMDKYERLLEVYKKSIKLLSSEGEQTREITAKAVSLMLENKALRDEVRELKSRLHALGEGK